MTPRQKSVLVVQSIYVGLSLLVALAIWGLLGVLGNIPLVADAIIGPFKLGGPIVGFAFVYWQLNRAGLLAKMTELVGLQVKAEVRLTPSTPDDYAGLFEGFSDCDFTAFNPPFKVEGAPGDHLFDKALALHEERYREHNVRSSYLFYSQDSYDRARRFFDHLAERLGEEVLANCIKLRLDVPQGDAPSYTYFLGEKNGMPVCIWYPAVTFAEGLPQAVVYLENVGNLVSLLHRDFRERWMKVEDPAAPTASRPAPPGSQGP